MQTVEQERDQEIRKAYESGEIYAPHKICVPAKDDPKSYADRLLAEKLTAVRKHYAGGIVLDLCCAVGEHLFALAPHIERGLGLDFSQRYIESAGAKAREAGLANLGFLLGDAKAIPLSDGSMSLIYSLSSLYAIPGIQTAIGEIGRVLKPGGIAVLDLGNRRSINTYCVKYYTDWPRTYPVTPGEMKRHLAGARLEIVEHRCFQILPLWAGLPKHLWPLLHPRWQELMRRRIAGRMIDEWVSSLPVVRNFAFRHLIVCRKAAA